MQKNSALLSRILTLAGYSPFLAEVMLRHPEHIAWLDSETARDFDRVKSKEQLSDELARFLTRAIEADDVSQISRFKRRELLRIYLRDCLGVATLSEVTEELSNLADVVLDHALARAHQEMVNRYGAPQTRDDRGRIDNAELAIVALGKLGCRELNYASDIDLMFLFSGNGNTAGQGRRGGTVISNKEFFTAVAERVVQLVGRSSGEGAPYRIDLRLRPYGRDGEMVAEIERAVDYYRKQAQNWERQALIRTRVAAGSERVVGRFLELVRDVVFTPNALPDTLEAVRRAKEQIDRKEAARMRGFNVKLGPGGIREIEFIAQALQLQHGGREPWVRSAQTLIVLARLAEKEHLTEAERARLSAAYTFLRTVEHRLQMEHGAQTHTLPASRARLALLARRCEYLKSEDPASDLIRDLEAHTSAVRSIYARVFECSAPQATENHREDSSENREEDETSRLISQAAHRLNKIGLTGPADATSFLRDVEAVEQVLRDAIARCINPSRSLRHLSAWAESLATYNTDNVGAGEWIGADEWPAVIDRLIVVLSSQYLSHLLISRPLRANALIERQGPYTRSALFEAMRGAVNKESSTTKPDALRRAWYRLVIGLGYRDMDGVNLLETDQRRGDEETRRRGEENLKRSVAEDERIESDKFRALNLAQTALAEASLLIASEIAFEAMGIVGEPEQFPFAVLGLGRLGHAGMDYGSDVDLLIVYDDSFLMTDSAVEGAKKSTSPVGGESKQSLESSDVPADPDSAQEFYAKLTAQLLKVLSSITREGLLYRSDLRLRPEGKSGPVAVGLNSLVSYITNRASAWEHSAYLKVRPVAGNPEFGAKAREAICEACFDAASRNLSLRDELREMRARQIREKNRGNRPDIKWGPGGMSDVYFITRYLQLRDRIDFPTDLGTRSLILRLGELSILDSESTRTLFEGYWFLRRLDHWMRLLLDRPSPELPASAIALSDLAKALSISTAEELVELLENQMKAIRTIYEKMFL
jgi:[glutamine synthetase] adenylyltransferase / [glutamine synthetase]-adenylyl-L-tyrosine phosphorylase